MSLLTMAIFGRLISAGSGADVETFPLTGNIMKYALLLSIVSFTLQTLSQGIVIAMTEELIKGGNCSLRRGFEKALSRFANLISAGLIIGILFTFGLSLFILPGLIVAYIFMYTFVIIMVEESWAVDALRKSYSLIRTNLSQTLILFFALAGLGLLISIINVALRSIPLFGHFVTVILIGGCLSFIAVVLYKSYMKFKYPEN
jgi:hypothetical protein